MRSASPDRVLNYKKIMKKIDLVEYLYGYRRNHEKCRIYTWLHVLNAINKKLQKAVIVNF